MSDSGNVCLFFMFRRSKLGAIAGVPISERLQAFRYRRTCRRSDITAFAGIGFGRACRRSDNCLLPFAGVSIHFPLVRVCNTYRSACTLPDTGVPADNQISGRQQALRCQATFRRSGIRSLSGVPKPVTRMRSGTAAAADIPTPAYLLASEIGPFAGGPVTKRLQVV